MSMEPPDIGEENWGDELNAYLASLEARVVALENKPVTIYDSYAWSYNIGAPPAAAGQVRFDTADPVTAVVMDFRKIDSDGADRTPAFLRVDAGSLIRINDWDNAAVAHRFNVTGPAVIDATNAQVPVAWESGSGALPTGGNAKVNVAFLVTLVV